MAVDIGSYAFDTYEKQEAELEILKRQAELALPLEKSIWEEVGLGKNMNILDIGCGAGISSLHLAEYASAGYVTGMDPSETLIANAKKLRDEKKITNIDFYTGDIYNTVFPEKTFDFIYCRFLFQHLRYPERALSGIRRHLKPEGIICVIDVDDAWVQLYPEPSTFKKLVERSAAVQKRDGGDRYIGSKLPLYLREAGYHSVESKIKVISSFDIGLEPFLKIALDFRAERLSTEETERAQNELKEIYAVARQSSSWGALGIFAATGKG